MATGRITWFNDAKGYGFIADDGVGPDPFVHYTGIAGGGRRSLQADASLASGSRCLAGTAFDEKEAR